ncbi:chromosome segregation protein SMC-like [Lachnospiraceae bacterium KM106-2]|nr:chromosome segregation protein SMC-like [Lachnospiraceae bacterium KM106-2]
MKELKRLLLIHWYKYDFELIDFDPINFLTGKTAAGKSTIIDALQLLILGDTTGTFFNKAANDKSNRTLKSYLYGENGDNEVGGYYYLRTERFTSYVAAEYEDTVSNRKFVTAFVADCFKDQIFSYKWLVINNSGFPEDNFINKSNSTPYELDKLRPYLMSWLHNKSAFEFCDTNKRYQQVTLGKFGQIKNKYRILFRKAVPFTPISDIEKFITESICDIKNNIDVEQMQNDIRQYRNLQRDAEQIGKRVEYLLDISEVNEKYESEREKEITQRYIIKRAEKEKELIEEKTLKDEIENNINKIEVNIELIQSIEKNLRKLNDEYEELNKEYWTSDIKKKGDMLEDTLKKLNQQKEEIENRIQQMVSKLHHYSEEWLNGLNLVKGTPELDVEQSYIDLFNHMKEFSWDSRGRFNINLCVDGMKKIYNELCQVRTSLKEEWERLDNKLSELEKVISDLKKGIKPFPSNVVRLQEILQQQGIQAQVFANLLEIKDERWRNAIEGYLGSQRFYFIVDEEGYENAIRIYDHVKNIENIHDVGIVDIGKLKREQHKEPMKNSLAEMVTSENKNAVIYANYILGNVIRCDHVEELNQHRIAITDEVMLYKGYVVRSINPNRYSTPYIGQESFKLQLRIKCEEKKEIECRSKEYADYHRKVDTVCNLDIISPYEGEDYANTMSRDTEYEQLKNDIIKLQKEYDELDFTYLDKIKQQLKSMLKNIEEKRKSKSNLESDNSVYEERINNIKTDKLVTVMGNITKLISEINQNFSVEWIAEVGEPRFEKEYQQGRTPESLIAGFYSAIAKTNKAMNEYHKIRIEKRNIYNKEFKMSYEVTREDNEVYDKELNDLQSIKLPEYVEKIEDAKVKAYDQFRDDFIAKLKSNIETVREQIKELNEALKQSVFGTDTYRFEIKPRPEYRRYYDMITDPMLMDTGGWNINSQSFNDKYQQEIKELFDQLIIYETDISAQKRAEYEKNIRKFTDYKTYLLFDLIVKDENGVEQRLSKTLLKKSGGETQIPFYISLLASFSQVCRIHNQKRNNTIRLIILDEAFSKMDGERIKECILLLRKFKLQAIFSAPPEKIADIAPLVDRNIAVFKDGEHSFTKHFDPKELEEVAEDEL